MLAWIKRRLRKWLLEDESDYKVEHKITCLIPSKSSSRSATFLIVGSQGLRLVGNPVDCNERGIRLIGAEDCPDQEHFWQLWRLYNPDVVLTWEDGTPIGSES